MIGLHELVAKTTHLKEKYTLVVVVVVVSDDYSLISLYNWNIDKDN